MNNIKILKVIVTFYSPEIILQWNIVSNLENILKITLTNLESNEDIRPKRKKTFREFGSIGYA